MGNKVRRGKIRATKVDPLERAEQTPPIKGSTGSESAYRDPKTGYNKHQQSNGGQEFCVPDSEYGETSGRNARRSQRIARELCHPWRMRRRGNRRVALEGDSLKMEAIRCIF
ncbi:1,4-alpha-glucan branching enzyme GlgB [Trichinella spiralis]|uniref:1,4-alpha-glucan branching enzyme GlgB n=1 Tax=Trichinella spiralis TaxID=6334 RepID=A0ABR3KEZ1_TRISP